MLCRCFRLNDGLRLPLISLLLVSLPVALSSEDDLDEPVSLFAALEESGRYSDFLEAVEIAGLRSILEGPVAYTVFALEDGVFDGSRVLRAAVDNASRDVLRPAILSHLVTQRVDWERGEPSKNVFALDGMALRLRTDNDRSLVNGSMIVDEIGVGDRGRVFVIDQPLSKVPGESDVSARRIVYRAIQMGAPMYNDGEHAACAAIYEVAVLGLLQSADPRITNGMRMRLQEALVEAGTDAASDSERAWVFRRVMDSTAAQLTGGGQP